MRIDSYAFGEIRIDGEPYRSDVIVWPHQVTCPWWRRQGHVLARHDLEEVLTAAPQVLLIGTGYYGRMTVPNETLAAVRAKGIEVHVSRSREAVAEFNRLAGHCANVVAALHLTC
jgi:hypothetical protein